MNYQPVTAGNQSNPSAGFQDKFDAEKAGEESDQQYVLFPVWSSGSTNTQNTDEDAAFDAKKPEYKVIISLSSNAQSKKQDNKTKREAKGKNPIESFTGYRKLSAEFKDYSKDIINEVNAAGTLVPAVGKISPNSTNTFIASQLLDDPDMPELEDITYYDNVATQTRSMTMVAKDQGGLSQMFNDDFHTCMFAYFLSQEEPKRVHQALQDPSWTEAIQEELLQFKMQKVFRNKNDERGIMIRNKARLVAQGHTHEEGIDYEEVCAPVVRIEAIRLFLAYASFMGFMVYQMDVKSAFLYGNIKEEIYDLCKSFEKLMKDKFQMSSMGTLTFFFSLQVKQKKDGIFIS
nr:putative ribonuclease H-like domain-containing protein [Tanacetum cinerariifolium]